MPTYRSYEPYDFPVDIEAALPLVDNPLSHVPRVPRLRFTEVEPTNTGVRQAWAKTSRPDADIENPENPPDHSCNPPSSYTAEQTNTLERGLKYLRGQALINLLNEHLAYSIRCRLFAYKDVPMQLERDTRIRALSFQASASLPSPPRHIRELRRTVLRREEAKLPWNAWRATYRRDYASDEVEMYGAGGVSLPKPLRYGYMYANELALWWTCGKDVEAGLTSNDTLLLVEQMIIGAEEKDISDMIRLALSMYAQGRRDAAI